MGRWLSQIRKCTGNIPTKLTQPSSVSFVSAIPVTFQDESFIDLIKNNPRSNKRNESETKPKSGFVGFVSALPSHFSLQELFDDAEKLNIELMKEDRHWLKNICRALPSNKPNRLIAQYVNHWLCAMENEPLPHKKQNVGRFAANTFLRESLANY